MPIVIVFMGILTAVCAYAIRFGGAPERLIGIMLLVAGVMGVSLEHPEGLLFTDVAIATLMIDVTLFAGMVAVALRANRYWPLWIAGIHATTLATHLIKLLNPNLLAMVYHLTAAVSAFPVMLVLVIATLRHRDRVRNFGSDPSWSDYFNQSMPPPPMAGLRS